MLRSALWALLWLTALGLANPLAAAELTLYDRIVAVVNEDPILLSDVDRALRLGLVGEPPAEVTAAARRRALDRLIEQRLRLQEVERAGRQDVAVAAIEDQVAAIRGRFASPEAFAQALTNAGIDEAGLRQLVARQLAVWIYFEETLGRRVFVSLEDIRAYYDQTLSPELARQGQRPPAIETVREDIRRLLKEQRLNEEIERKTAELLREANLVDFLATEHGALPPAVLTLTPPP